jgi:hypothetical protein
LRVERQTNVVSFDAYFLANVFDAIQKAANDPKFIGRLATVANLNANQFQFREVAQFRGTSILDLRYDATDRASAEAVSTSAALLLRGILSTNSLTVDVELVGVRSIPAWEDMRIRIRNRFYQITGW